MKKIFCFLILLKISLAGYSQLQDAKQLVADIEKLAQMKLMLNSMYDGYAIVSRGYNQIAGLSKGNFDLHKNFLDELLEVSSGVKKYKKIATIIASQTAIVQQYRFALTPLLSNGEFTSAELLALRNAGNDIIMQSEQNLDELILVTSSGRLRMSDNDRISMINRIDMEMSGELLAIKELIAEKVSIARVRQQVKKDIGVARILMGL